MSLPSLFDQRPVVRHDLWELVSSRFHPPPVNYLRRMGFTDRKPLPPCTLDAFFQIQTETPRKTKEKFLSVVQAKDVADERKYQRLNANVCRHCSNALVLVYSQGFEVCVECGNSALNPQEVATCASSSLGGPVGSSAGNRRITSYIYKRTNHFIDHLKRVQAKQTSSVKPEIIATVENELRKERIFPGDERITTTKVRAILKKLRLQKFYVYTFQIASKLSGKSPPCLTTVQEEKLLEMFQKIQEPFEKHCPSDRTNMLNYSYILRKLTQILGWTELMDYFPLLKSRSKVYAQDMIWKKICEEADFPFHKSIA
jgi:hypothetical protein